MNTRVYEMNTDELKVFVRDLKYDDLLELNGDEIRTLKKFAPGLVENLVDNEQFPDMEERIFYKGLFSVKLTKEDVKYLRDNGYEPLKPPRTKADYPDVKMTEAEKRYFDEHFKDWGYIEL